MSDHHLLPPQITLDEAISVTSQWRQTANAKLPDGDLLRGFNIPLIDLTRLVEYANLRGNIKSIRAYLGYNPDAGPENPIYKLILVPVGHNGTDVLSDDEAETIFDFTRPCPALCDTNSPLYMYINRE